jgi:hypothetical protein
MLHGTDELRRHPRILSGLIESERERKPSCFLLSGLRADCRLLVSGRLPVHVNSRNL